MKLLFVFTFIIYGIIISAISYSISHYYQIESTKTRILEIQRQNFNIKSNNLKTKIERFEKVLESIRESNIFKNYVDIKNDNENVIDLFSVMMNNNKELSQLRFINLNGDEEIRFERNMIGDTPLKIEENEFQNKKNRYYFKNIKETPSNSIWYSKLDLNIEHGKIEIPIVPTLRIGTSVYSKNGFEGILIMNIFFEKIIQEYVESPFFYISIYDKDGEFIHHKHLDSQGILKDYSWTRYLKKDTNFNIHKENLKSLSENKKSVDYIFKKSIYDIIPNRDRLFVYYGPKISKVQELEENDGSYMISVTIIVLLISIPLSFIISIIPNMLNEELYQTKEMLEQEMNTVDEYVYLSITDRNGIILDVSRAYLKLTGFKKEELIGKKHNVLKHPNTPKDTYKDLWNTILSKKVWEGEICNLKSNGKAFYAKVLIKPNLDDLEKIDTFTAYIQDITYQKEVEKTSVTDELTQLYNRREFNIVFKRYVEHSKRYEHSFSMAILDIDYFKQYNDTYGHLEGDKALKKVAFEIKKATNRNVDFGFRLGGEEFGILFSASSLKDAKAFSERIKDNIENLKIEHKNSKVNKYLTVSIGLIHLDKITLLNEEDIFNACDKALYEAKASGRNQIKISII